MANYTANYNLKKPLSTEEYNVDDQNGNMDIIDAALAEKETPSGAQAKADAARAAALAAADRTARLPLEIPVPDANPSVGHPSVAYDAHGFNGYKYWMAFTPYPDAGREDPNILCSNNGVDWTVPEGLTNSVFEAGVHDYGNNSDTHLIFSSDRTKLLLYFRGVTACDEAVFYSESTDGVHWTAPVIAVNVSGASNRGIMSPSVIIEDDGTFVMWSVNSGTIDDKTKMVEKRTSTDGIAWGPPVSCNTPPVKDNYIYHLDVHKFAGTYYMLALSATVLKLRFLTSGDGINWTWSTVVPLSGFDWDRDRHYRSCFIPVQGNPVKFDLWVTGIKLGAGNAWDNDAVWGIGYYRDFELTQNIGNGFPTLSFMRSSLYYGTLGANSNLNPNNGDLCLTPIFVPRKLSVSEIGIQVITSGSEGAVLRLGIYADDGEGMAESLILDAGTVDAATEGFKSVAVNQPLEPGLYWIGAVLQGDPATGPTVLGCSDSILNIGAHDYGEIPSSCYRASAVTDDLPACFSAWGTNLIAPKVLIRIA